MAIINIRLIISISIFALNFNTYNIRGEERLVRNKMDDIKKKKKKDKVDKSSIKKSVKMK